MHIKVGNYHEANVGNINENVTQLRTAWMMMLLILLQCETLVGTLHTSQISWLCTSRSRTSISC